MTRVDDAAVTTRRPRGRDPGRHRAHRPRRLRQDDVRGTALRARRGPVVRRPPGRRLAATRPTSPRSRAAFSILHRELEPTACRRPAGRRRRNEPDGRRAGSDPAPRDGGAGTGRRHRPPPVRGRDPCPECAPGGPGGARGRRRPPDRGRGVARCGSGRDRGMSPRGGVRGGPNGLGRRPGGRRSPRDPSPRPDGVLDRRAHRPAGDQDDRDPGHDDPDEVAPRHPLVEDGDGEDDGRHRVERAQGGGDIQPSRLGREDVEAVAGEVEERRRARPPGRPRAGPATAAGPRGRSGRSPTARRA